MKISTPIELVILIMMLLFGGVIIINIPTVDFTTINEVQSQAIITTNDCVVYRSYSKDLNKSIYSSNCHILIQ